jgi:hypothetical protein
MSRLTRREIVILRSLPALRMPAHPVNRTVIINLCLAGPPDNGPGAYRERKQGMKCHLTRQI